MIQRWVLPVAGNVKGIQQYICFQFLFNGIPSGCDDSAAVFASSAAVGLFQLMFVFLFSFEKGGFVLARARFLYNSGISRTDSRYETLKT